jgi:glutathionyl-hydroquinone reductase
MIIYRLFPTTARFDMAYYTIFNCNLKQIRYDYPNLHRWLRELYYEVDEEAKGAFKSTTHFDIVSWNMGVQDVIRAWDVFVKIKD